MTEADLHWLAGWLEGEGSFQFVLAKSRDGYTRHNFSISASSVDKDVIRRAGRLLETKVLGPLHPRNPKHQDYWAIRLSARDDVLAWCLRLYPLMSVRRKVQIDALFTADAQYPRRRRSRPTGRKNI